MSEIKLSIIIPVFGVENYIEACIQSIFSQLTDDVECIFVDDGCKDKSINLLKTYLLINNLNKKNNIKIIRQENQGVSMARNNGIAQANGAYIGFLDSDDIVCQDYLRNILKIISNNIVDIVHFNAWIENKDGNLTLLNFADKNSLIVTDKSYLINNFKKNKWYPWLRVFKKDLLNNFYFPKGYLYEDIISIPLLYKEKMNVYELKEPLLIYKYRSTSITKVKASEKHINSIKFGVRAYRNDRKNIALNEVYYSLVVILFSMYLKLCFKDYVKFVKDFEVDIINLVSNGTLNSKRFKMKIMFKYPKVYYFYKNRLGLRKYR